MKTRIIHIAVLALAGTMAASPQEPPAPPVPPQTPQTAPAPRARPARPARAPRAEVATVSTRRAYMGVDVADISPERSAALKLKEGGGVEITMVDQDAPAGKAGLKEHDVILSFNGKRVTGSDQLRQMIRDTAPNTSVPVAISRDGQPMTVNVKLADRRRVYVYKGQGVVMPNVVIPKIAVHIPDIEIPSFTMLQYSRRNGLMVEGLTPQLAAYFGVRNGEGVLVRSVEPGTPAEAAGFHAGDVIVRVDKEAVADAGEWNRLMREHAAGTVPVTVMREKREQTLSLAVPARRSESFVLPDGDMEELRREMESLGPEMRHNQQEMAARIQRDVEQHRRELQRDMERMQRDLERQQRELQRQQRDLQRQQKPQDDEN